MADSNQHPKSDSKQPQTNFWGELILQLRTEQKISQRQLSVGAKVHRTTLRQLEAGKTQASVDILIRLLRYLGYELEAMLYDSVPERVRKHIDEVSGAPRAG